MLEPSKTCEAEKSQRSHGSPSGAPTPVLETLMKIDDVYRTFEARARLGTRFLCEFQQKSGARGVRVWVIGTRLEFNRPVGSYILLLPATVTLGSYYSNPNFLQSSRIGGGALCSRIGQTAGISYRYVVAEYSEE